MVVIRRDITVYTPGKHYVGEIDVPNAKLRTTDLLNRENLYWKDPAEKKFDDSLLMFNVTLSIEGIREFQKFDRVQIRQPNIIFFHDDIVNLGDEVEKKRVIASRGDSEVEKQFIHLITKVRLNSFFDIKGSFFGLFKMKSNQKYLPLSDVVLYEIINRKGQWMKRKIDLVNNFIGVNTRHVETCVVDRVD